MYRLLGTLLSVSLLLDAGIARATPPCDLADLQLPEKDGEANVQGKGIEFKYGAKLIFDPTADETVMINEVSYGVLQNASQVIRKYITESAEIPNDACDATVVVGQIAVYARDKKLLVEVPLHVEIWQCIIGMRALLAEGQIAFTVTYDVTLARSKPSFSSSVVQEGGIETTVPNIDPQITAAIEEQLSAGTTTLSDQVRKSLARIEEELNALDGEYVATEAQSLYRPKIEEIWFEQMPLGPALIQKRVAEVREGTTCTIRRLAPEKWSRR
ncbi:hypothetical protein [Mesorhizobium sp.]|uniref:hypothetical protein n=1 Tax=Mesorhizobium sp. TaxID=1871066 RepID=UPI000FEA9975|nr:hypothetical protein [Mesorhizobium sp.]RWQ04065.1 MAG: hypothetical protein EOR89_08210 [Mesorhizobium sp.]RWQ52181.1 MAG: hypothetical protein EOS82_11600 [Mesorhizobium sp.]